MSNVTGPPITITSLVVKECHDSEGRDDDRLPTANDLMVISRFFIVLVPNTSVSVKLGFSINSFVSYLIWYSLKVRLIYSRLFSPLM